MLRPALALALLAATPAFAGLASIPIGSASVVSPCDGIDGAHVATGSPEVLLEIEGVRTNNADGSVRFTQARAELTRVVGSEISKVCLDARSSGAIVLEHLPDSVRLTQKKNGADLVVVRAAAQRTTVTAPGAWWDRLVLPRAGGATVEGHWGDPHENMVLDPDATMVLDPDATMVLDPDATFAWDTHAVFQSRTPGPQVLWGSLPVGPGVPGVVFALVSTKIVPGAWRLTTTANNVFWEWLENS